MCCFVCCMTTISLQFGYKDSANRRQCKIKVPKLLFLLLRCSLSYQKIGMKRERHLGATPFFVYVEPFSHTY